MAVLDTTGKELVRHGPSTFLGELNLLPGQTVFWTVVATEPTFPPSQSTETSEPPLEDARRAI